MKICQTPILLNWKQKNVAVSEGDAGWPPLEIAKSRLGRHLPGVTQVLPCCFRTDRQIKPALMPALFLFNDFFLFFLIKQTSPGCCSGSYHSIFSFITWKNALKSTGIKFDNNTKWRDLISAETLGQSQKDTDQLKKWSENTRCNSVKTSIKTLTRITTISS